MEVRDAIRRAVDWLRANPTKHIALDFAIDQDNFDCAPNDPKAECFCAIGRISHELGSNERMPPEFIEYITKRDVHRWEIWECNDQDTGLFDACFGRERGNPAVLDFIEEKLL